MTLRDFIEVMEGIAEAQPAVNHIIPGDIYLLNSDKEAEFACFCWQSRQHMESLEDGYRLFSFQLFYVDRMTSDRGNILEAQSVGLEVLSNIIKTICEDLNIDLWERVIYQPFVQKFTQQCAGTFATVTFRIPAELCEEDWL